MTDKPVNRHPYLRHPSFRTMVSAMAQLMAADLLTRDELLQAVELAHVQAQMRRYDAQQPAPPAVPR